jgi:hypothetical protein
MENTQDLSPLIEQVQRWWDTKHQTCGVKRGSNSPGLPSENLYDLLRNEDLIGYAVICPSTCGWRGNETVQELVSELQRDLKANAVRAAGLLNRPNEQIAERVASALLPTPYGQELTFVTDLIKAAGAQTVFQRKQTLTGAGIAAVTLVGFCLLGLSHRKAA